MTDELPPSLRDPLKVMERGRQLLKDLELMSAPNQPPDDAIDIGPGHRIVFADYDGETAGINEWHQKADGAWCMGWVSFKGSKWANQFPGTGWDVVQREPLTLSPSIACRVCGSHGHIRNGKWEPA